MLRSLFVAVLVLILLGVAVAAAILQGDVLQATFLANPYINGVIGVGLVVGVVWCFVAFWRAGLAASGMRRLAREEFASIAPRHILGPTASLLHSSRNNQVNLKLTPQEISALLDQIAGRQYDDVAFPRFLSNLLILLGLIGTFWGLLETIRGIADILSLLPQGNASLLVDRFSQLQSDIQKPLAGMATAFSSSLFGLSGSLLLSLLVFLATGSQRRLYFGVESILNGRAKLPGVPDLDLDADPFNYRLALLATAAKHLEDDKERLNEILAERRDNNRRMDDLNTQIVLLTESIREIGRDPKAVEALERIESAMRSGNEEIADGLAHQSLEIKRSSDFWGRIIGETVARGNADDSVALPTAGEVLDTAASASAPLLADVVAPDSFSDSPIESSIDSPTDFPTDSPTDFPTDSPSNSMISPASSDSAMMDDFANTDSDFGEGTFDATAEAQELEANAALDTDVFDAPFDVPDSVVGDTDEMTDSPDSDADPLATAFGLPENAIEETAEFEESSEEILSMETLHSESPASQNPFQEMAEEANLTFPTDDAPFGAADSANSDSGSESSSEDDPFAALDGDSTDLSTDWPADSDDAFGADGDDPFAAFETTAPADEQMGQSGVDDASGGMEDFVEPSSGTGVAMPLQADSSDVKVEEPAITALDDDAQYADIHLSSEPLAEQKAAEEAGWDSAEDSILNVMPNQTIEAMIAAAASNDVTAMLAIADSEDVNKSPPEFDDQDTLSAQLAGELDRVADSLPAGAVTGKKSKSSAKQKANKGESK